MTWFLYTGRESLGSSVSIEIYFVFVVWVEIDMISMWGVELDLISVKGLELTVFCVGIQNGSILVFRSKLTWFCVEASELTRI